jgi:ABC-type sugar transport system ATPase subunit
VTLRLNAIEKAFGGIRALRGVDFEVAPGEIVGLVGGNGAGKSTLMKIASGVHLPDSGSVEIDGSTPTSPADAIALGVSLVRQELIQADDLDVASNVLLGHEPHRFGVINRADLYRRAERALQRVGGGVDPRARLGDLRPGIKQRVEIARALSLDAKILLLDEPTATLTGHDADQLFELLDELRRANLGMVYISHRLPEVLSITDRIVCLRDGERVAEFKTKDASIDGLVEQLAGSSVSQHAEPPAHGSDVMLEVQGRVAFQLRKGEILGLAGLVGAGRTSLLMELFGVRASSLQITIDGKPVTINSPRDAIDAGIALVPEERATQGLILDMLVEHNIALPSLHRFLLEDELKIAKPFMQSFGIRGGGTARMLSGGNQQKIVLSKWMLKHPKVLLLDEPTRGLDVGAKADVYRVVRELATKGTAVIVSSSETEEIAGLCHRSLVMSRGRASGKLARGEMSDANILRLAT